MATFTADDPEGATPITLVVLATDAQLSPISTV